MLTTVALAVFILGLVHPLRACPCHFYQEFRLSSALTPNTPSVRWLSGIQGGITDNPCRGQAVLQVTPPVGATSANVDIAFDRPYQWSFNVGDSPNVNGYGGGSYSDDGFVAEIHNVNLDLQVYQNVQWKIIGPPVPSFTAKDYFNEGSQMWHLSIGKLNSDGLTNARVAMNTSSPHIKGTAFFMINDHLFKFDTFYVGINRVISGPGSRVGSGACSVCINFT